MIRREFMLRTLGAAMSAVFARGSFGQTSSHAGMQGMDDMGSMPGMASMPSMHHGAGSAHQTGGAHAMTGSAPLASADALPAGAPLAMLRTLPNESREPGVFRATLVAQPVSRTLLPGHPTTFWQYDGGDGGAGGAEAGPVVGPMIEVREGDTVEIRFVNRLAQPSTIHWHGLPVPPDQDGNPADAVAPGGSRVYRFTLPPGSAGTYWYHPHPHQLSAEQVFRGLAGPIIVRAPDDPLAGWPERHLFFTDLKLAADGAIAPNYMMDWMNGREGQFVLVNGARRPRIAMAGDERWRVWNACNARYLLLTLGDDHPFAQVGTDGGLLAAPREGLTRLLLAPGERAELIVRAKGGGASDGASATPAVLTAALYDRRKMSMTMSHGDASLPPSPAMPLADVEFAPAAAGAAPRVLPARLREIAAPAAPVASKTVVFSEQMDMATMHQPGAGMHGMPAGMHDLPAGMRFLVNGASFDPARITLTSRRGDVERWSIDNQSDMDHPFHLHGTQFQVVERVKGGVVTPEPFRAWRDTVNVEPGEIVRISVQQQTAGERMFHCHILEHEDLGMMGTLKVV
ncbi:multicopper oxidase family protein [Paraburkholderia phosphatilytica]|uniref:multicopper oxidase family protein n=1 Tax=Paraburkholderia phosphatilytica TaxID=2282883 RepID=UPI000E4A51C1|nr:multicopper oxidase family protein [Paraburkholderia phosphatilytica]